MRPFSKRNESENFFKNTLRSADFLPRLPVCRSRYFDYCQSALETPYFTQITSRFTHDADSYTWIDQLCAELVNAGVAQRQGDYILNA